MKLLAKILLIFILSYSQLAFSGLVTIYSTYEDKKENFIYKGKQVISTKHN